jgi:tight adherence protein C
MTVTFLCLACFGILIVASSAFGVLHLREEQRMQRRILSVRQSGSGNPGPALRTAWLLRAVEATGTRITNSGLLPKKTLGQLEDTLRMAGLRQGSALAFFVVTKLLLLVSFPLGAILAIQQLDIHGLARPLVPAIACAVGLIGPDYAIGWMRKRHLAAVNRGLPDALDMMIICAEAGLGLEPAIVRVATEIRHAHPQVAEEFSLTASELRITADARAALINTGTRTGLESVKRVMMTLAQTLQYGTPLTQALRTLSAELRQETLTRFEARAARLPVLLTVPMIVFILPCVFLVVGGPAAVQVLRVMGH